MSYRFNGMRLCDKCNKYVYCNPSIGPCGTYTMKHHHESECEATRNPCEKCGIFLNNDEVAVHLFEYCIGNTVMCPRCMKHYHQRTIQYHTCDPVK